MGLLDETLNQIQPLDEEAMEKAASRWKNLYTGMGDLGKMETMVTQFAGVTGEAMPAIPKCCTVIACSDHGVYAEGVSAYPQSTTVGMTKAYVETKGAAANAMAYYARSDMVVVDMGINADMSGVPNLLDRKIAWGTKNIAQGPAMTRLEAIRSIETGIEIADEKARRGTGYLPSVKWEFPIPPLLPASWVLSTIGMPSKSPAGAPIFPMNGSAIKSMWCRGQWM